MSWDDGTRLLGQRGLPGIQGENGDSGIGFNLTSDGRHDLQDKRVYNLQR